MSENNETTTNEGVDNTITNEGEGAETITKETNQEETKQEEIKTEETKTEKQEETTETKQEETKQTTTTATASDTGSMHPSRVHNLALSAGKSDTSSPYASTPSSTTTTTGIVHQATGIYSSINAIQNQPDIPSKVIHVRNVIESITKSDITMTFHGYGRVAHCVLMRDKKQALVQYANMNSAMALMNAHRDGSIRIKNVKVYLRYSRHQELKMKEEVTNRIILVTIGLENILFGAHVTADMMWYIFSPYGFIEKLIIIRKENRMPQALIQFASKECAINAHRSLSNQTVYTDQAISLTMGIQYSRLAELNIVRPGHDQRDYLALYKQQVQMKALGMNGSGSGTGQMGGH